MSLSEEPTSILPANGIPQSSPEPEVVGPYIPALLPTQHLELVKAELRNARLDLDETTGRLLHSRICHQFEAQSREILQRGLDAYQQQHFQLARNYRSIYDKYDFEKTRLQEDKSRLQEDLRIANELVDSQKQLIDMYQSEQQQQPASHLAQGGPLLPQYNNHNHSCQYSPYQPPRSNEFAVEPAGLPPLNDFDYSIGSPIKPSCDTRPVMSTPVTQFEEHTPNLSVQSAVHLASAERDVPVPTHAKSDGKKRGSEDEGAKFNKRRKTNS